MKQLSAYRFIPVVTKDKTILIESPRLSSKPSQSLGHPQEEITEEKVQVISFLTVFDTLYVYEVKNILPFQFLYIGGHEEMEGFANSKALDQLSEHRGGCGVWEMDSPVHRGICCSPAFTVTMWKCGAQCCQIF